MAKATVRDTWIAEGEVLSLERPLMAKVALLREADRQRCGEQLLMGLGKALCGEKAGLWKIAEIFGAEARPG